MNEYKRFSLVKPTLETPFHIDFDWWKHHDNNWRVYLHSCLCDEHQLLFSNFDEDNFVDWVDPESAQVKQVDGLQSVLMSHCAKQPGFITEKTTLVNAVFRYLLANRNTPVTPIELAKETGRQGKLILRTLSGPRVYKGLRPCQS